MNEKVLKCLHDIKLSIAEIDSFIDVNTMNFEDYKINILVKRGVERNLEIIGEAMNRILREEPDYPIENAHRIVGLRNQIIHGYDMVSDENIWGILINYIPKLKAEVNQQIL